MSAALNLASTTSSSSSSPHLYVHALESIFAFLPLASLASAVAVSHEWSCAISTMRSIDATLLIVPKSTRFYSSSILASRHVKTIGNINPLAPAIVLGELNGPEEEEEEEEEGEMFYDSEDYEEAEVALADRQRNDFVITDLKSLQLISSCFNHLHTFVCAFASGSLQQSMNRSNRLEKKQLQQHQPSSLILFPPTLTHLTMTLRGGNKFKDITAILLVISQLPLLRSFEVRLPTARSLLNFIPFRDICKGGHLREFGFNWPNFEHHPPSDIQIHTIRTMHQLKKLRFDHLPSEVIHRLLRSPMQTNAKLEWSSLGESLELDAEACELLPSVPSLTSIRGWMAESVDFIFLMQLPNLSKLWIDVRWIEGKTEELIESLQRCIGLTSLGLSYCQLSSDHVHILLQHLTNLRELELRQAVKLTSLRCFSTPPICLSLERLNLSISSDPLPRSCDELIHLHALKGLTSLNIQDAFTDDQPNDESIAILRDMLPNLTELKR